jgi:hypothetical protein
MIDPQCVLVPVPVLTGIPLHYTITVQSRLASLSDISPEYRTY